MIILLILMMIGIYCLGGKYVKLGIQKGNSKLKNVGGILKVFSIVMILLILAALLIDYLE